MPYKRSCLRYAHTNGQTHCCYTDNGDNVITTGADGDIRIWNGVDDDDPNTQCVGEFILYHVYYGQRILTSTDLNTVQAYTYPDYNRDGTEFRFTAPVTCIKVNAKFVVACSEDMTIKVTPRDDPTQTFELIEHTGPVLRIDLSTSGLLASSSGDGTIKIWDLTEKKCIKTLSGFDKIKSYQETEVYVTPSFEPKSGKFMAYNHDKSVIIVDTQNWAVKKTLTDDKNQSKYSVCSYSKCGKYLAAGTEKGDFSIWDIDANKLISEDKSDDTEAQCITAIDWNPNTDSLEFAYTDNTGQFGLIENIGDSDENIIDRDDELAVDDDINFGDLEFPDDPEDADNENCVSLEKLKNETMKRTVDDEIDEFLEGSSIKTGPINNGADDADDDGKTDDGRSTAAGHYTKTYDLQSPFQPGETPKTLEHRYMVWNHVGIVRAHSTTTENSIEVEFHDASIHHGLHMVNHLNHTMASLSTTILALCTETPSKLVCIILGGSGGSREWSMSMPNCEEILCVAASTKLVAVATDARFLRIFSAMGTQREIVSLPGPVVAVAAHDNRILVAYHSAAATEDQHISMMLFQTIGLTLRCREFKVSLTPNTKLTWIGFTDKGSPVAGDTMGIIRIFSIRANHWIPVCDTSLFTKGASDSHFIIEVSESAQIVRSILCRGSTYPLTTPKPMVSELKMQMPVCDLEAEQSQLEETLIRNSNFYVDESEKNIKEIVLKLFAIACRSESEPRAKELIEMIAMPMLLPLVIKYATKLGRIHLAEKLGELLPQFEEQEREREKYDENEAANELLLGTPTVGTNLIRSNPDKTPATSIIPKPLSISQLKRNPFKKTPTSGGKAMSSAFKHLTDTVIGFDSQETSDMDVDLTPSTSRERETETETENQIPENHTSENFSPNITTPKPKFVDFFKENRPIFESENPQLTPAELTKFAMNKFKQLYPKKSNGINGDMNATTNESNKTHNGKSNAPNAKRKINTDEHGERSGIAKLARFSFGKQ